MRHTATLQPDRSLRACGPRNFMKEVESNDAICCAKSFVFRSAVFAAMVLSTLTCPPF